MIITELDNNNVFFLEIEEKRTLSKLKLMVEQKTGIHAKDQILLLELRNLCGESRELVDMGVGDGAILLMKNKQNVKNVFAGTPKQ